MVSLKFFFKFIDFRKREGEGRERESEREKEEEEGTLICCSIH